MSLRNKSFIWGCVAAAILLVIGIVTGNIAVFAILAVTGFTLVSCLILDNNFLGEMIVEIFSWGFVRMPGVIFTLDLDGIIWLLTVKLLFWILGLVLALVAGLLAIALGLVLSVFVYPFALVKNIRHGEEI
ncbi:MAG: hypothetical protein IJD51_00925 [Clostridia bacterium]|nr:hypothetical protein [Clostridia bacterium]